MGIMQFMDRAAPLALDPAIALLGNEEQGAAFDWAAMRGFIRDRVTGANNWLGDPNAKVTYASPSAKWIWNAFGVLTSGTTLRCDHDPASLDSSMTPLNSLGIGSGAVVNKSIVLASGTFSYPVGEVVRITDAADISKWILGRVVSWTAGTKTLVVAGYAASGSYVSGSNWKVIVALGIRIESQRTNLLLRSDDFTATWQKVGTTTPSANSFRETSADSVHYVRQSVVFPDGSGSLSLDLKSAGRKVSLQIETGGLYANRCEADIDIDAGTTSRILNNGTYAGASVTFGPVDTDGYRRVTLAFSTGAKVGDGSVFAVIRTLGAADVTSFVGDPTKGVDIRRAQLEVGAFASSYIPTTTAQVTRAADNISLATALFPYSSVSGVLAADFVPAQGTSSNVAAVIRDSGGTVYSALLGSTGSLAQFVVRDGGASQASLASTHARTRTKMAGAYKANDFRVSIDGAAVLSDTSGTVPAGISVLQFGAFTGSANVIDGWIRNTRYFPRATVTDAELQAWAA